MEFNDNSFTNHEIIYRVKEWRKAGLKHRDKNTHSGGGERDHGRRRRITNGADIHSAFVLTDFVKKNNDPGFAPRKTKTKNL